MPLSPFDIPMGPVSEFCVYHLLDIGDPTSLFLSHLHTTGGIESGTSDRKNRISKILEEPRSQIKRLEKIGQSLDSALKPATRTDANSAIVPRLSSSPPTGFEYLGNIASVIRSKNAGPHELTFDVMFLDEKTYTMVKDADVLHSQAIARLYSVKEADIVACVWWVPAFAFKATIKRRIVGASFGDSDAHGSAHHVPLLYLTVPLPVNQ